MAAKIPTQDALGQRPIPQPGTGVSQYRGEVPGLEAVGEASLRQAGAMTSLSGAAGAEATQLLNEMKVEQDRIDNLRAEEALTTLKDRRLDLTAGEGKGFRHLKGGAAVNRPIDQEFGKAFDDEVKKISSGLANDKQRERFALRAANESRAFREDLMRHRVHESDVWAKEVADGTVRVEARNAVANWDNPLEVASSIIRIESAIKDLGERNGWPKEMQEAERLKALGVVHSAVVNQALATGNYVYAQKWYEEHKADIDLPTAKAVEVAVRDGTQKQIFNGYQGEFIGLRQNRAGLAELEKKVSNDPTLSDDRKNALLLRIQTRTESLLTAERIARDKWERQMERGITKFVREVKSGFVPSADEATQMVNATRGTPYEAEARQAVALAQQTRGFMMLPPPVQAQELVKYEAAIRKDPSKYDREHLAALQSIHDGQVRALKADGISFMVAQGVVDPRNPAVAPMNFQEPFVAGEQLAQRYSLAQGAQRYYGVPINPLTNPERDILTARLKDAKPEEKLAFYAQLHKGSRDNLPAFMATMQQIAPDAPVEAIAGAHAGHDRMDVASLILRGQSYLSPPTKEDGKPAGGKLIAMPPDAEFEREFARNTGNAFAGAQMARSATLQSVRAAYAALASDKGGETGLKTVDPELYKKAFDMVVGGVTRFNGREVIRPYGMTDGQFKDGVKLRLQQLVEVGAVDKTQTVSRLYDLPLVNVGDQKFQVMSGDAKLVDKKGKDVVLDFSITPHRFSGDVGPSDEPERRDITDLVRRTRTER